MSSRLRHGKAVHVAVVLAFASLAWAVPTASAASGYGELARFGTQGTGSGQLSTTACVGVNQYENIETCQVLIGVDPNEGNSVFVLDQPKAHEELPKSEPTNLVRHFRIQKFTANGEGHYEATASVEFEASSPLNESTGVEEPPAEGIAIDPETGRLYVLISAYREEEGLNFNDWAAGELLSYSTASSEGHLTPEGKEGGSAVLVGPTEFNTFATKGKGNPEQTLLDPRGITVDPYSHEVIILGHVRTGGHTEEHFEDETGETEPLKLKNGHDRYVLQRIDGTSGAFGEKYVEESGTLLDPPFEGGQPDSPVVAGTKAEPRLYVNFEGLVEIPYDFSTHERAKQVFREDPKYLSPFSFTGVPARGGSLSALEGRIYEESPIITGTTKENQEYTGIFVRSGLAGNIGEPLFWTGGQTPTANSATDECVLEPGIPGGKLGLLEAPVPIAAGSGGVVFALAPEFLATNSEHAAIVEFGPGGRGCPNDSTQGIKAYAANQQELPEGEEIEANSKVTFKVPLQNADAREVEWKITEGGKTEVVTTTPHPVPGKVTETPKGKQEFEWKFSEEGLVKTELVEPEYTTPVLTKGDEATVEAVVKTDNGVTNELTTGPFILRRELPSVIFSSYKPSVTAHVEEDEFSAVNSKGGGTKYPITEWEWNFGDGSEVQKISGPSGGKIKHAFIKSGTAKVTLVIKDAAGDKAERTVEVTVKKDSTEIEEEEKRKAEEAAKLAQEEKEKFEREHDFALSLASTRVAATTSGNLTITFRCNGKSTCAGSFSLQTSGKVKVPHKHSKSVLKLGSGRFSTIAAQGGTEKVTVHLSKANKLALFHDHTFKVTLNFAGRDAAGETHPGRLSLTLVR